MSPVKQINPYFCGPAVLSAVTGVEQEAMAQLAGTSKFKGTDQHGLTRALVLLNYVVTELKGPQKTLVPTDYILYDSKREHWFVAKHVKYNLYDIQDPEFGSTQFVTTKTLKNQYFSRQNSWGLRVLRTSASVSR